MSTNTLRKGFTLIELLVVVAIIAVIGAGVAVTYNRLDERAKTAMEINDIGVLGSTIKNWSFLHDWKLPNGLDSLITTEDELFSWMPVTPPITMGGNGNCGGIGLYAQSGYTFEAHTAPTRVISNLAAAGLTLAYLHDTSRTPADDTTFTTGRMGADVDTSSTAATLSASGSTSSDKEAADEFVNGASDGSWPSSEVVQAAFAAAETGGYTTNITVAGVTYSDATTYNTALATQQAILDANLVVKTLAFVNPEGGATMRGMTMAMNMTHEIISNCGLTTDTVARPTEDYDTAIANGRTHWLVVFGLGRFASIYSGKGARIDTPAFGKRYTEDESMYTRYLAVIKVPVTEANAMTGTGELSQIACILSPQGLSAAALNDSYRNDVIKTSN